MIPSFVTVGPLIVDELVFSENKQIQDEPGGSLLYSGLTATLFDQTVGAVTVMGNDYPHALLEEFRKRKIAQEGVKVLSTPGHRFQVVYKGGQEVDRGGIGSIPLKDAAPTPKEFPETWLKARGIHLAPYTLGLQAEMIDFLENRTDATIVWDSAQIMTPRNQDEFLRLIGKVDCFFPSERELALPGVREDPRSVMRSVCRGRLKWLGLKRGPQGVLLYDRAADRFFEEPAPTDLNLVDPTGAGDTFCSAFLSAWLRYQDLQTALRWGTAAAGLTLESEGAFGLLSSNRNGLQERYAKHFN